MGFSIKRLFRSRETPEQVSSEEITEQQIEEVVGEIYLRELAFWACISRISSLLAKCEFRTYLNGGEKTGEEYYTWNYSPNKNQNKTEFWSKAIEKLYRENELLIIESYDGQMFVADSFTVKSNTLYGDTYSNVQVGDYQFQRSFKSSEVLHWTLNNQNVNQVLSGLYNSYSKLIAYSEKAYMKSKGSRGILEISAVAQASKNFDSTLQKMMNEYFKNFFKANNAVLPLYEGYKYNDIGSKTYSEGNTRDIKSQHDDIFEFTARALNVPPSLVMGNVQDTSKAIDEILTFCLDPLADMLQVEINRKRNGASGISTGTKMVIHTSAAKHTDLFDIATSADKLISSGMCTVNMLLREIGEPQINELWANRRFITKNYTSMSSLEDLEGGEGGEQ